MVERLKLALRDPRLLLILKSLVFGGFLTLVKLGDFGFFSVLFFLAVVIVLYTKASVHSLKSQNLYSFVVLLAVSLGAIYTIDRPAFLAVSILAFSALFYLILGIKELVFIHRQQYHFIKNILLLYTVFALFFLSDKSSYFLIKYLAAFSAAFFIFREWFFWFDQNFPKRYLLASLLLAFIVMEILWAIAILPIGFLSSANLMILTTYILIDSAFHHFHGTLTKKIVLRYLTVFVLGLLVILGTSRWVVG